MRAAPGSAPLPPPLGGGPPPRPGEDFWIVDPERALAVAYAPAAARPGLTALFALDERLGALVAATTEPTIGLIRLAWWREALERLDHAPPPTEPLLTALAAHCLPCAVTGAALAGIEDGWAALLDGEADAEAVARHGARGATLFQAATCLLTRNAGPLDAARDGLVPASTLAPSVTQGPGWTLKQVQGDDGATVAGAVWGLADLGHRHSQAEARAEARAQARAALARLPRRWPKHLRPLGALAVLARHDASVERRAQGSPGRLLRMLALRGTGV